ncbi:ABC transporter permease subunit [[Clostridium] hylemonae]|uniref:ABC transporter permease subunit n=1 Tax=[Clostridium] hylemonae TaxID=89153 RepID=UPI0011EEFDA5
MLAGIPWPAAILVCLIVGGMVGVVNGFAVAGLKIPPLIATLAVEQITRGIHLGLAQGAVTRLSGTFSQYRGRRTSRDTYGSYMDDRIVSVLWVLPCQDKDRRLIYAVGGNPEATRIAGINNKRLIMLVYIFAGLLCSIAGIIVVGRMNSVAVSIAQGSICRRSPHVFWGASVTIGGKGKVSGTFLGILIMGLIQNSLDLLNVSAYWQTFIQD